MVDKIFGTDFTNETNPTSGMTLSVNNGTNLVDVSLADLYKGLGFSANVKSVLTAADYAAILTLLFSVALPENVSILLDSALSADGKYSGICEAGTAGEALAFGDVVYLSSVDSRWKKTDADAAATAGGVKLGVCVLAAAAGGDATIILLYGKVRADSKFPALTIGAPVYLSVTPGEVVTTAPSGSADIVRIVGYGNTADELFFCPDATFIELA